MGSTLREGLHAYQAGKKVRPIIQQYLTILFPSRGLPAPLTSKPTPPSRAAKRWLAELATMEWEEEPKPSHPVVEAMQPEELEETIETLKRTGEQEPECNHGSPRPKRRRLDRKDGRKLVKDIVAPIETSAPKELTTTLEIIRDPRPIIMAQSQRGKGVLTVESEVLKYPDIPDTAHEFNALLQFGTTYELMEFLATQHIKESQ